MLDAAGMFIIILNIVIGNLSYSEAQDYLKQEGIDFEIGGSRLDKDVNFIDIKIGELDDLSILYEGDNLVSSSFNLSDSALDKRLLNSLKDRGFVKAKDGRSIIIKLYSSIVLKEKTVDYFNKEHRVVVTIIERGGDFPYTNFYITRLPYPETNELSPASLEELISSLEMSLMFTESNYSAKQVVDYLSDSNVQYKERIYGFKLVEGFDTANARQTEVYELKRDWGRCEIMMYNSDSILNIRFGLRNLDSNSVARFESFLSTAEQYNLSKRRKSSREKAREKRDNVKTVYYEHISGKSVIKVTKSRLAKGSGIIAINIIKDVEVYKNISYTPFMTIY